MEDRFRRSSSADLVRMGSTPVVEEEEEKSFAGVPLAFFQCLG